MKNKLGKILGLAIIIIILLALLIGKNEKVLFNNKENRDEGIASEEIEEDYNNKNEENISEVVNDINTIEIVATGDILIHKEILETQYNSETDEYDFNNNFKYIKKYLEKADLAIGNLETTLSGIENYGFSGYPSFNSPDSLADAMKSAGYDIVANMNNHCLDRDVNGYYRTRKTLVDRGFDVIGTRESIDDKRYIIKDVKGINVGVISYGYTMTVEDGNFGVNGISIPYDLLQLMNYYHPDTLENDMLNMKEQIELMREDGAEVIVFYMHWGDEYELEPNDIQKQIAQFLADEKVDIIFGTHPHSLQPIDMIQSSDGSSDTAVVYSMGNFLSSQRTERIGNPYTEDGAIVSVKVNKDMETNEITVDIPTYIPTWVNWYGKDAKLFYEVVPATIDDADYLTEEGRERIKESFDRTTSVIENYDEAIEVNKFIDTDN
ncbi:CapA family protein [Clostridium sp. NSJ-6]|uniref:CapA family protein n=1 Tax=Clostridium hominis TaxID=2763036 RepID=A0ABR7DDS9_9CLOT|nr:CapA family protein [Clostridium hominis]MBC5629574.1 CapA family protein [Clostridium hominis]